MTVLIYGYYGTHGHRPRLLGIGMAILASGAFIFALPQLISGKYSYVDAKDLDLCGDGLTPPVDCSNANQDMYAILCVGAILVAAGSSPLYALGPTHMDFLLDRKTLSKYLKSPWVSQECATPPSLVEHLHGKNISQDLL